MPRDLDAAMGAAHEMTREPVVQTAKVPVKAGAPAVKVDKSGHRVRLRSINHALEGCISTRNGEERYRLEPNRWTVVSDAVYNLLREKFYTPQEQEVVSWNGDPSNPIREVRTESHQEYIVEFPEENR